MFGLALADFGRDPRSGDSLRGGRITHDFTDLPSNKFYDTKTQKLFTKFPVLATSGRHINSAMITDAENSLPNGSPTRLSSFHFYH